MSNVDGLRTIAVTIQHWLDWQERDRAEQPEPLGVTGDTHLIALPVPAWPTRSGLEAWVAILNGAAEALLKADNPLITVDAGGDEPDQLQQVREWFVSFAGARLKIGAHDEGILDEFLGDLHEILSPEDDVDGPTGTGDDQGKFAQ